MSNGKRRKREDEEPQEDDEHLFDDWPEDPEAEGRFRKTVEGFVPDIFKRSLTSGIGSLLMSDDGLRSLVAEKKLPKEAVSYLINQADATKREIFRIVSREVREFLENMDFGGELTKILTSISFEIRTEVRFIPNDAAVKPNVRNRVNIKKTRGDGDDNDTDGDEEFGLGAEDSEASSEPKKRRWPLGRSASNPGAGAPAGASQASDVSSDDD